MVRRRLLLTAFAAGPLISCASPNPVLYTIAVVDGPTQPGPAPQVIALRTVGLARYLERPGIVLSAEDYRLAVSANDWWGEPLGAMISRVLIAELARRLPTSTVFSESSAISAQPDATAEVNIQRMDADAAGILVLDAQLGVSGTRGNGRTLLRTVNARVPLPARTVVGQVAATSTALGQVADGLAALLVEFASRPAS